jgi:fucose permease
VTAGLVASEWGYASALAVGAGATAVGLAIFAATILRGKPVAGGRVQPTG